jgi:hypothetical protein
MMRCATPISWLRLERYHLDELSPDATSEIRAHVTSCDACRQCLDSIEVESKPLRPLPLPRRYRPLVAAGASVLALAACLLLLLRPPSKDDGLLHLHGNATKGGELAFALVSEDGSIADGDTLTFREGERFHARVTCPPSQSLAVSVAVFTGPDVDTPIVSREITCGNAVDVPGAFQLTGRDAMRICLVFDASGTTIDEGRIRAPHPNVETLCKGASPIRD